MVALGMASLMRQRIAGVESLWLAMSARRFNRASDLRQPILFAHSCVSVNGRLRTGVAFCVARRSRAQLEGICALAPSTCVVLGLPRPLLSAKLETLRPSLAP
jgi:hypothetical protein